MKSIIVFILINITVLSVAAQDQSSNDFPELRGPYLGQTPPDNIAKEFASDIIKTGMNTRDIAMNPDGKTLYFSTNTDNHSYSTIYVTKQINGIWTKPEIAEFANNPDYNYGEPCIDPSGKKMYFVSTQPTDGSADKGDYNIWVMDKVKDSWSKPKLLDTSVNTELNEFFPSVTQDGTIYFTRTIPSDGTYIFRSKLINNSYTKPEKLGKEVNSTRDQYNAFISPDESFLIVPNGQRADSYGATDYYVCFRNDDDTWLGPYNLGDEINSKFGKEWSASVSPDGKYLFFMSDRGPGKLGQSKIFWIDAKIIEELKPKK